MRRAAFRAILGLAVATACAAAAVGAAADPQPVPLGDLPADTDASAAFQRADAPAAGGTPPPASGFAPPGPLDDPKARAQHVAAQHLPQHRLHMGQAPGYGSMRDPRIIKVGGRMYALGADDVFGEDVGDFSLGSADDDADFSIDDDDAGSDSADFSAVAEARAQQDAKVRTQQDAKVRRRIAKKRRMAREARKAKRIAALRGRVKARAALASIEDEAFADALEEYSLAEDVDADLSFKRFMSKVGKGALKVGKGTGKVAFMQAGRRIGIPDRFTSRLTRFSAEDYPEVYDGDGGYEFILN